MDVSGCRFGEGRGGVRVRGGLRRRCVFFYPPRKGRNLPGFFFEVTGRQWRYFVVVAVVVVVVAAVNPLPFVRVFFCCLLLRLLLMLTKELSSRDSINSVPNQ